MSIKRVFSKSKINQYFIELSIIVVGITLSFAVQSHLTDSENTRKQIEAYRRISEDLALDREYFNMAFANNEIQIAAAREIVAGNLNQTNFNQIVTYYGTFFNDNTITSIMSTGLLEDFENQALISEVLTYYRQDYDFLDDAARFDEEVALQNLLLIAAEVRIDSVSTTNILRQQNNTETAFYSFSDSTKSMLKKNNNFIGLLQSKIWVKYVYNNFISNALKRNISISAKIHEELSALQ